jgi:hypothetical protein
MIRAAKIQMMENFKAALQEAGITVEEKRPADVFAASAPQPRLDALLRLNGQTWLALEVTRSGYPRDVREAIWRFDAQNVAQSLKNEAVTLVVLADHLTAASREMLRKPGLAYFDSSGSLFLKIPSAGLLIDIERAPIQLKNRRAHTLFTPTREQVLHALLQQARAFASGVEIAAAAQVSAFTVSQTLAELDKFDWIETRGSGPSTLRRLSQPGKLLDAWAQQWQSRKSTVSHWYRWSAHTQDALALIEQHAGERSLLLTGAAAANRLAPWLTSIDRIDLITPPGSTAAVAQALELQPAEQGGNITLIERSGASGLFTQPMQPNSPLMQASAFILYLDLLDGRGRNKELAQHLRETHLKI